MILPIFYQIFSLLLTILLCALISFVNQGTFFLATTFFVISGVFLSSADCMFVSSCSTNVSRLFVVIESRLMSFTNFVMSILLIFLNLMVSFLRIVFSRLMVQLTVQWSDM